MNRGRWVESPRPATRGFGPARADLAMTSRPFRFAWVTNCRVHS
jgi:hypothetical protein